MLFKDFRTGENGLGHGYSLIELIHGIGIGIVSCFARSQVVIHGMDRVETDG